MRLLILAAAAVTLGACHDKGQSGQVANPDQQLAADNIMSNDVTAIDAVTADAANMAADVDYSDSLDNLSNNSGDAKPKTTATTKGKASDSAANAQ